MLELWFRQFVDGDAQVVPAAASGARAFEASGAGEAA
jgi:hypothetical protein